MERTGLSHRLAIFMWLSSIFVTAGAVLLRYYDLVPVSLTYLTSGAVVIVMITSIPVHRRNRFAINFGVILSAAAIISSASSLSHIEAMLRILDGGLITVLDILEILGFYLFPLLYLVFRFRGTSGSRAIRK